MAVEIHCSLSSVLFKKSAFTRGVCATRVRKVGEWYVVVEADFFLMVKCTFGKFG